MESKFLGNRYFVLRAISLDRSSKTLLAIDLSDRTQRRCAIEMLTLIVESSAIRQQIQQQFSHRMSLLEPLSLQLQHLPLIYTHFYSSDICYLVRELITGITLEQKVRNEGTFTPQQVRRILKELLQTLVSLHDRDLVHYNIKPENIILRDEDNLPVLVGFSSIEPNLSTASENRVSLLEIDANNYAAPENLIEDSQEAKDLYNLGLTAIYLLTGKSPQYLQTNFSTDRICLPKTITALDAHLVEVIERAINPEPDNYYGSATEMLLAIQSLAGEDFQTGKQLSNSQKDCHQQSFSSSKVNQLPQARNFVQRSFSRYLKQAHTLALGKLIITLSLLTTGVAIAFVGWIVWQNERTLARISASQLEKAPISAEKFLRLPPPKTEFDIAIPPQQATSTTVPADIPIFVTGTQQSQLIAALGKPGSVEEGYWTNSNALLYENIIPDAVDVSYLVDKTSGRLRQTEIALSQTLGLAIMQQTLSSLLQGNTTPDIETGLQQVYQRQIDSYSFEIDRLEGTIQRIIEEEEDNVYIGIWEADFH